VRMFSALRNLSHTDRRMHGTDLATSLIMLRMKRLDLARTKAAPAHAAMSTNE